MRSLKASGYMILLSFLTGACAGIVGALFSYCIVWVTAIRIANDWLIWLLPVGGMISVWVYRRMKTTELGTNQVLKSADGDHLLSPRLTPAVFIASVLSHLFGASVGREGAALQIGGGLASGTGILFRLREDQRRILMYAGMASGFAAVFGTPLTAIAFALEVVCVGRIPWKALVPATVASLSAYGVAWLLGSQPERFVLSAVPAFSLTVAWQMAVIAMSAALLSMAFCYGLHYADKAAHTVFKDGMMRIAVGGLLVVCLTALVGSQDYNGAGFDVMESLFHDGVFHPEAFVLKLLFTVVTVAAGFKGGEIVPSLFIGSTFGAAVASVIGLSPSFGAAIGMIVFFCGVSNCPTASFFLAAELFEWQGVWYFIPVIVIGFVLSGKVSLYEAQQTPTLRKLLTRTGDRA